MSKIKKITIILFFLADLIVLVFLGVRILAAEDDKKLDNDRQSEESVQADRGLVIKYVDIDDATMVSEENLNLAYSFSGKVEKILAPDGTSVKKGDAIMKLETTDLDLEMRGLKASLTKSQANLDALLAGATKESIQVYQEKVRAYNGSLKDAKKVLVDVVRSAYTVGEDAVRGKTNQMFSNPDSSDPQLNFTIGDSNLERDIESRRGLLEEKIDDWKDSVDELDYSDDLDDKADEGYSRMGSIQSYLDQIAKAVNQLTLDNGISQTTIDSWKSSVSSARINVDTAKVAMRDSMLDLRGASGERDVAQKNLVFMDSKARSEEVKAVQSEVDFVQSQIDILNNKLEKSILRAPMDGMVMKTLFEESEVIPAFPDGQTAVIFSVFNQKLQADVPEEDIANVNVGNNVHIKLKAFPDEKITGKVTSIDPQPLHKNGDVYYRTDISLDGFVFGAREGMTADAKIEFGRKETAIRVPNRYVEKAGGKKFVNVLRSGKNTKAEIETGISDESFTEIISGVNEREVILMPQY